MSHRARPALVTAAAAALLGSVAAGAAPAHATDRHRPLPAPGKAIDVEAHRGGIGLTSENTLEGFRKALHLGVTTLELDIQITKDGKAVVTHDRQISADKCRDTAPVRAGDPQYPYVGKYVKDLTLAQVRTVSCDKPLPDFPGQEIVADAKMPQLKQVFALVRCQQGPRPWLNVETKVEAGAPEQTAPREQFVQIAAREIRRARMRTRVTIQSFDWGSLKRMREVDPRLPLVALTNASFLQVGLAGASPWLGGLDADDFGGSFVRTAAALGVDALSPVHATPQDGAVADPDYVPYTTPELVESAHRRGLAVVPWTVDDPATMAYLLNAGVDGIITNHPDRLRAVLAAQGRPLPQPTTDRPGRDCLQEAYAAG